MWRFKLVNSVIFLINLISRVGFKRSMRLVKRLTGFFELKLLKGSDLSRINIWDNSVVLTKSFSLNATLISENCRVV